ncbi:MAG: hypothetical protein KF723_04995 [Rhizobiaceae bacterium]|nr:hypothetical protein [Rhizobiaceae bacterium]
MPQQDKPAGRDDRETRHARLSDQLRANLQRRKAQARSRRSGEADDRPEGLEREATRRPPVQPE